MQNTVSERRRNDAGEVDYFCPMNHHVMGENVLWRMNGNGKSTPTCRKCRTIYRAENRKKNRDKEKVQLYLQKKKNGTLQYDSMGNEIPLEGYLGLEKRSAPWNLLRPSIESSVAFDDFHEALKYTDVPCRGKSDEYTEYADPRAAFNDDNEGRPPMPGRERARLMCAGCPLFDLCKSYAHLDKPDIGVWAGERWLGSKLI